jgi:hypothetical protein
MTHEINVDGFDLVATGTPRGEMDLSDFKKALRASAIAGISAGLVWVAGWLQVADLGPYGPLIVIVLTGSIDSLRRFFSNTQRIVVSDE